MITAVLIWIATRQAEPGGEQPPGGIHSDQPVKRTHHVIFFYLEAAVRKTVLRRNYYLFWTMFVSDYGQHPKASANQRQLKHVKTIKRI